MLHTLEVEYKPQAAVVWLSRPDVRNALDPLMIAELTQTFEALGGDPQVRAVVLAGRGIGFCAGSDVSWMRQNALASDADNLADSQAYAAMLRTVYTCPKPTIARLHGICMAAGMGLAAACDIAIASSLAIFALPETRLGLVPAVIAPYVLRAMNARQATRWFLTGETFSAAEAWRIGFVHDLCEPESLDMRISALVDTFTLTAPDAVASTKALVHDLPGHPIDDGTQAGSETRVATQRDSEPGHGGGVAPAEQSATDWSAVPGANAVAGGLAMG